MLIDNSCLLGIENGQSLFVNLHVKVEDIGHSQPAN